MDKLVTWVAAIALLFEFKYNRFGCLNRLVVFFVLSTLSCSTSVLAHGGHAAQPNSIIDPLITHHAVLEDEFKLNFFGSNLKSEKLSAVTASLELAYAFTDLIGIELFAPFGLTSLDGETRTGLGDLELQFPKVSFVRRYGWVMTAYPAIKLPTGNTDARLGGGVWVLAPHLLTDIALGPIGLQLNGAYELATNGDRAFELRGSVAYTFALKPELLLSPLLELNSEIPLTGEESAHLLVVPGVKLAIEGWHVGVGVQLPVTNSRPFDYRALLQVGYHVSWNRLIAGEPQPPHSPHN